MTDRFYKLMRTTRRPSNLGSRPGWFKFRNAADDEDGKGPVVAHIYDEIGMWGVDGAEFVKGLMDRPGDLELHINSPGGDVFDSIAIFNTLKQRTGLVEVVIDGLAASAASFIAQAASEGHLYIAPHAQMMIHDGFTMAVGNAQDMRELADRLDAVSDNIAGIYADRTGLDRSYWREQMRAETWFDDAASVESGLADAIHGQVEGANNAFNLQIYAHAAFRGATSHPPFDGNHRHSHTHDDETHSHDHHHDDDASHDHAHSDDHDADDDGDGSNSLRQLILNAAVDESPWDADRAMREAGESANPASAFNKICAGRREGPASERKNHALPHHYPDKTAPNAAGVRSALGYLSRTEGLINKDAAERHLHAHMKAINPDWSPDGDQDQIEVLMRGLQEAIA